MSDGLEILCIDSEKDVLHSVSIDVARNKSCSAYSLYSCLVAGLAYLAIEFNVLHCKINLIKCVTQFFMKIPDRFSLKNPIAPKRAVSFYGAAKIDKIF